jgi:hypothetical protein
MSDALKGIVQTYIRLGNFKALNDLKAHRAKLLTDMRLKRNDAFDVSSYIDTLETEIAIIDEALEQFGATANVSSYPQRPID